MKKISSSKVSVISIVLMAIVSVFAVGQMLFALIGGNVILEWLKNAHIAYYTDATAVSAGITKLVIDKSFQSLFTVSYIRVMSMYIFVLCIPIVYALFNVYLIAKNGKGRKPFSSDTISCLKSIYLSFGLEFLLATVLFVILKLIMKVLPFYFMYAMAAVAVFSIIIIVVTLAYMSLITRMEELRDEHIRRKTGAEPSEMNSEKADKLIRRRKIVSEKKPPIKEKQQDSGDTMDNIPAPEPTRNFTSEFDDILSNDKK